MTLKQQKQPGETDYRRQLQTTPIAIIGMASIFPQAKNLQEYWQKIVGKVDCITEVPPSRWKIEEYYDSDPKAVDKTYCKRGGFIPEIDFNPIEFGLPPNLIEITDISQLLSLVVAKNALEDAGYSSDRNFNRERTGVILGTAVGRQLSTPYGARLQYPVWEKVLSSSGLSEEDTQKIIQKIKSAYVKWEENSFPGMLANIVAGRIANRLDLGGTNCTIDAACASSLAALKMAVSELHEHRADMMITGGVDTDNSIFAYMCFSKTPALSQKQQTRPFDIDADGMMLGEGLGMLVLKRLEDAERDGDRIYAVIKGIGTSSDGRNKSIYAPRVEGQVRALRRAYEEAGFSPQTVSSIEAHGTGTLAGDPTEFEALKEVFAKTDARSPRIALGSVKSQIGHTKAAAGAASLIKTALALHHKLLPATINISKPNPKLKLESSPFYLNTETRPWMRSREEVPRRAGVSSFGFGGTNYHVVLEEYTGKQQTYRLHKTPQSAIVCADNRELLLAKCQNLLSQLQGDRATQQQRELIETSSSLQIPLTSARIGFVTVSVEETRKKLETAIALLKSQSSQVWEHPQGIYYRQTGMNLQGKVAALFSGQGSQYLEMGRDLAVNFPEIRQAYSRMDRLFVSDRLEPVSEVVFPPPEFEPDRQEAQVNKLQRTEYSQPAIGAFSFGLYKILQKAGFKPDFVAGHSFGELTALWAAEALSDGDYCFLVKARGRAMAVPDDPNFDAGGMIAVKGEASKIVEIVKQFPQIAIANYNSPQQIVLAGAKPDLAKVKSVLTELGYEPISLAVSAAFHTSLVDRAQQPFARAVDSIDFRSPKIPVYTNVTGELYSQQPDAIANNLKLHLKSQVKFQQEIEKIYSRGGRCFVEIGPRNILSNLVKDILGDRPHVVVALNGSRQKDSDRQLREALVQLRVAGLALVDFDPYHLQIKTPETQTKSNFNFRLSGYNYVSEKTKLAFKRVLENKELLKLTVTNNQSPSNLQQLQPKSKTDEIVDETTITVKNHNNDRERIDPKVHNPSVVKPATTESPATNYEPINTQPISQTAMNSQNTLQCIESNIAQFDRHQEETLHVHGQYLNQQLEYVKIFFQLMQQQTSLFVNGTSTPERVENTMAMLQSVEKNMMRFHEHQTDTLRVHQQSLTYQSEYAKNFFQLIQQKYKLLSSGEIKVVPLELTQASDTVAVTHKSVVGTGLINSGGNLQRQPLANGQKQGADSVETRKRSSSERSQIASVPSEYKAPPVQESIVGLNDRSPVQELVVETNGHSPVQQSVVKVNDRSFVQESVVGLKDRSFVQESVDNNGHTPSKQDSIAPSEIAKQSQNGHSYSEEFVPIDRAIENLKTEKSFVDNDFVDRSILENGKITDRQTNSINTITSVTASDAVVSSPASTPIANNLSVESTIANTDTDTVDVDVDRLIQMLLEVVGEKTGYPPEMLELDMDMEADLGIDSIKRVEILGAMQEKFPDAPTAKPEDLGEVRTLGQIIEQMRAINTKITVDSPELNSSTSSDRVPELDTTIDPIVESVSHNGSVSSLQNSLTEISEVNVTNDQFQPVAEVTFTKSEKAIEELHVEVSLTQSESIDLSGVSQLLLEVVGEKTGYPPEMLELDMDMEADLGIDSIKRVEILGAMQEKFPNAPQASAEDLGELRTLGQIIDYLQQKKAEKKNLAMDLALNSLS